MCLRKATIIASCSTVSTVERGVFSPVGRSVSEQRFLLFANVVGLVPYREPDFSGSFDYAVWLEGPPPSLWRFDVEPVP